MRILVYEFICATLPRLQDAQYQALLPEGRAMLSAIVHDLATIFGHTVTTLVSREAAEAVNVANCEAVLIETESNEELLAAALQSVDAALLILPEGDAGYCRRIAHDLGVALLGPSEHFAMLAANKQATAERLRSHGVNAPLGVCLESADTWPTAIESPAVIKPVRGCGCQDTALLRNAAELHTFQTRALCDGTQRRWRLERHVPGQPVSVALLCGASGIYPLPPCRQKIEIDSGGSMSYAGGSLPIAPVLAERAQRLAVRALQAMPEPHGYIGVDLVLGSAADGNEDYVIEINPRLTTSYVGLRAASRTNLAQVMLDVVAGREPWLDFRDVTVCFDSNGNVHVQDVSAGT